jgi:phospholipid/cholesterol/gamma-HCH transport system substrate-binding protein
MAENRAEVLAGFGILALALGFLAYAGVGQLGNSAGTYDLTASFRSANGIAVGTDVRLAGVKVGTISDMALNPQTYFADVVVTLDTSVQLPTDTAILISSEGLLGGNFIELVPGGAEEILAEGQQIEDTQSSVSLINLLMKFVSSGDEK